MFDWKLPTHRRGFLGRVAGSAAALSLTQLARPFELSAAPPQGPAKEDPAVTAWLGKLKGKHRQLYDTPELNNGFALAWSRVFYMTNNETGVADADMSVMVVLRHAAIPLAMVDAAWAKYKFGEFFKITDPKTNAPAVRNIFYKTAPGELPPREWTSAISSKRGCSSARATWRFGSTVAPWPRARGATPRTFVRIGWRP